MRSSDDSNIVLPENVEVKQQRSERSITMTSDTANVFLLQGMKMILGEMSHVAAPGSNMRVSSDMAISADTGMIKKIFVKKLDGPLTKLSIRWKPAVSRAVNVGPNELVFKTKGFTKNYQAEVAGIRWYLYTKLASQIAFVLLMLGVTALAFILAYRSLLRQEKLNTMKNDLINNMSHELKTPVATVKVALEALGDQRVMQNEQMAHEYLGMATMELDRLELLLGKVLNTSMLDSKHALLRKEPVNLGDLINESLQTIKMRAEKAGAEITTHIPVQAITIVGDKVHIQGVLLNLIDNSLKYAGIHPRIQIELNKSGNTVSLCVKDNGKGIPSEYINKVFDKFFRVPNGNVHNTKGYGLGLSYAKQVMSQHGGSIDVVNLPEGGCRFELKFKA